jgi:hypothetical protein
VAVELTIGREDLSGEIVDHDEGSEADGHIDLGRPDERARWSSAIERMRGVLGQLELGVVRSHPEVLLDRRVDEAAAERGEDRDRQEDGEGPADYRRAHQWLLRPSCLPGPRVDNGSHLRGGPTRSGNFGAVAVGGSDTGAVRTR